MPPMTRRTTAPTPANTRLSSPSGSPAALFFFFFFFLADFDFLGSPEESGEEIDVG